MDIQNRNVGPFEQYCIDEFSMCHDDGDFERDADSFYESIETERLWRIWELQIAKAQAVPEGFVVVPKEPTFRLSFAYQMNSVSPISSLSVSGYKAMIAAAQEPTND